MHLMGANGIGGQPTLRPIPAARGVVGGNMTNRGPLSDGIDGNMATWCQCGITGIALLGLVWAAPAIVRRVEVQNTQNNWTAASQPSQVDFTLQASNDSTTITDGAWADISTPITRAYMDTSPVVISGEITNFAAYRAHRLRMRQLTYDGISIGQLALDLTELTFFDYSYI